MAFKIADIFLEAFVDWSQAEKDADNMETKILGMTRGTIAGLATGFGAAGTAIVGSLGVMAGKAAEFQDKLAAVSSLGVKDLGAIDTGVRDLAVKFGLDLNESVAVVYDTLSAGIPEEAAIMVMEKVAKGAQAGMASLGEAMDVGTGFMNAWNLQGKDANETAANMERIMGEVATAVEVGKMTMSDMASSIGQVAPLMAQAGVSTTEFNSAVAALTSTNLPASSAMGGLRAAVSNIIVPSEKAKETAESLGLEFNATALKTKGLAGFLADVRDKTGGNIETMGTLFGSVEGLGVVMSLTGNQAGLFKDTLGEMANSQEKLNAMSDAYTKNNPALEFAKLKALLASIAIDIGRGILPALVAIAKVVAPIMQGVSSLLQVSPTLTAVIITGVGALGALLLVLSGVGFAIAGLMPLLGTSAGAAGFGGLAAALKGAAAAALGATGAGGFGALAGSLGAVLAPMLPIVALLGVIAAAAIYTAPTIISTAQAFWNLAQSNMAVYDQGMKYAELLQQQGVALDMDAIKHMSHANRIATINEASIAHRESLAAREIQAITGAEATRQQIHIAELARVGLGVSAKEAAHMAVQGMTQAEIEQMMAKGDAEQQAAQRSQQTQAMAVAASSEAEEQIRQDKTATIGHFQWAADKEAQMMELARRLKTADHYERKLILSDLARMEQEKAAAERQWAMENQALTASEIAAMNYKTQQKEAQDARWVAVTEGRIKADQDMLYKDQDTQLHSIKVQGDAITRQKAHEAEQRKKMAEMVKDVESKMEDQIGKEKLERFNAEIQKVQELGDFKKLSEEQIAQFKREVMKGDVQASMDYWQQLSAQANAGYVNSLEQYKAFSAQMQAEAAIMRQALAYAVNPNQTGSPSLNMEVAGGLTTLVGLYDHTMRALESRFYAYRDVARASMLVGAGLLGVAGTTPGGLVAHNTPSSPGAGGSASGGTSGSAGAASQPMLINAPVTVQGGTYTVPDTKTADHLAEKLGEQVAKKLGQQVARQVRGRGQRSVSIPRGISVQG